MSFELYLSHITIIKVWGKLDLTEKVGGFKNNFILILVLSWMLSFIVIKLVNVLKTRAWGKKVFT